MSNDKSDDGTFIQTLVVADDVIDVNDHINNVTYVQWMQEAAVAHSRARIDPGTVRGLGSTWVARSHHIEYLSPGFAGDVIEVRTWLASIRRVRCQRRYEFFRVSDEKLLAKGETDWVFVNAETGRPSSIPEVIRSAFPVIPDASNRKS